MTATSPQRQSASSRRPRETLHPAPAHPDLVRRVGRVMSRKRKKLTFTAAEIDAAYRLAGRVLAKLLMEMPFRSTSLNPEAAVPVQPRCATPPIHSREGEK